MNASDTRSKKSLKEHVSDLVGNTTITQFWHKQNTKCKSKQVGEETGGGGLQMDRWWWASGASLTTYLQLIYSLVCLFVCLFVCDVCEYILSL